MASVCKWAIAIGTVTLAITPGVDSRARAGVSAANSKQGMVDGAGAEHHAWITAADEIDRATRGLMRRHVALGQTVSILRQSSDDSMRRLSAYQDGGGPRDSRARAHARALYKTLRGGLARALFTNEGGLTPGDAIQDRLARAQALVMLARNDVRQLASHHRAEHRAIQDLATSERGLAAAATLGTFETVSTAMLAMAGERMEELAQQSQDAESSGDVVGRQPLPEIRRRLARTNDRAAATEAFLPSSAVRRPVHGSIVGKFGAYEDEVLKVWNERAGVELRARVDERVLAYAAGQVVFVGTIPMYGDCVVIDHGTERFSLTARLWKIEVREGDSVAPGQVLGRAAVKEADDGLGSTIYFELRAAGVAIDPQSHLH